MELNQYLQSLNTPDPNKMIDLLQKFFKEINAVSMTNPYDLVSLYSTMDVLSANGLNKDSVKSVKMAIQGKMIGLSHKFPGHTKPAAVSLCSLISADRDLDPFEKKHTEINVRGH